MKSNLINVYDIALINIPQNSSRVARFNQINCCCRSDRLFLYEVGSSTAQPGSPLGALGWGPAGPPGDTARGLRLFSCWLLR